MRQRIYTDTSVIGGCFDEEFGTISEELINEFKKGKMIISISDLTLKEIENSPKKVQDVIKSIPESNKEYLVLDGEARFLAKKYIEEGAIRQKYLIDSYNLHK